MNKQELIDMYLDRIKKLEKELDSIEIPAIKLELVLQIRSISRCVRELRNLGLEGAKNE